MSFREWKEYKLGDVLVILTDYHANGSYKVLKKNVTLLDNKEYSLVIRTKNFEQNNFKDFIYITKHSYDFLKKSQVFPRDIIMNKIANAGSIYLMPDLMQPVSLGMNLFLLRVNENITFPEYIYYYLKTNEAYVKSFATGSVTSTITKEAVRNLNILIPSIEKQNRIISILKSIEDKIVLNQQTNQTLEAIAQTLFKEMCLPKGDVLPNGWRVGKLGDICNIIKGVSYRSSELIPSKFALVTLKSLNRGGGFNFNGFKEFDGKFKESQVLLEGDVVIAQTDLTQNADVIGCPAIVENPYNYEKLIASIDLVKCQSKDGELTNEVLFYFLQNQTFKDFCLSHINGSTVLHLRSSELSNYEFAIPNKKILDEFDKLVKSIRNKIITTNHETKTLIALRDSLLPKLMKGEIEI